MHSFIFVLLLALERTQPHVFCKGENAVTHQETITDYDQMVAL